MNIKLSLLTLLMLLGFSLESFAQVDDTLPPWFKTPMGIIMENGLLDKGDLLKTFGITPLTRQTIKAVQPSFAKKVGLPTTTRTFTRPITLKYQGACYTFACAQGKECKDCKMVWVDRNRDRKIQPRRELRCVCVAGKPCKVRVKKTDCR
ncbi:MAG: hypothetical protein AAFR61_32440 [Bacteroidota bacterium]